MTEPRRPVPRWAALRWAVVSLFLVGGIALFGALIYWSGPARVLKEIVGMGIVGFLAVAVTVIASMVTWSLSWYALLRGAGIPVSWPRTVAPLLAGFSVSYLTPSMYIGGEPVRAYWVAQDASIPTARVMATAVVERILSGFSTLAFVAIGALFAVTSPQISLADKGAVGIALGAVALFLVLLLVPLVRNARWFSRLLARLARAIPSRRLLRAAAHVATVEDEIHRAFTSYRGATLLAFGFQLLTVFLNYIRPQVFFHFTQRSLFTFPQLSLYFMLSFFVNSFLWIAPGGFGVTDGGRVAAFTLLGVSTSGGVAFNVVFRFVDLVLVGIGVQLLLRRGFVRLRRGRFKVTVDPTAPSGAAPPEAGGGGHS